MGADRPSSLSELHFRLLERYAPPSVLVDGQLDVIHVSEHAGRYFAVGGGEPTKQVLRLVMPELQLDLRSAIHATQHSGHEETRLVRFEVGGTRRAVELRVVAGVLEEAAPGALLVFFEEREALAPQAVPASSDPVKQARDQLRAAIERYEISNEELAASNEELHAINEQLRSTTAELEGSKQALESMNQELAALNEELRRKLDEIGSAGADLDNLMSSADLGVLFLDRKLDIRRFTPRAQDLFNLIATDRGRPLSHTTHRLEVTDLAELSRSVLRSLRAVEREVTSTDGRRYVMRLVPYRSQYERVDGVIVTFLDVTELRAAEEALTITEQRLAQALRTRRPPNSDEQLGS